MDDLISKRAALEMIHEVINEFFDFRYDDEKSLITEKDKTLLAINKKLTNRIKVLPSAQTSRIEKILYGKSPKEQFKIIERIFATGRYWTDSRQAISDWFDGKEMPLFDYYINRHD